MAKKNIIPLKELNLTDRFLFDEVMEDTKIHQEVLSLILGREISLLQESETEKESRISPLIRSIRMDLFAIDSEEQVYNTEMQKKRKDDLPKRSRYYQGMMDTGLLEPGIPSYNLLNDSYLIMIMPFDLFGYEKYQYTFVPQCQEVPQCKLQDGTVRIFLNTKGKNDDEVPKELAEFLHYVEHTTDELAQKSESEKIRHIHERVCEVKRSEEIGVKYMQAWEEKYYEREEGREEGIRAKLKELVGKKLKKGKTAEEIADMLEEEPQVIKELIKEIEKEGRS